CSAAVRCRPRLSMPVIILTLPPLSHHEHGSAVLAPTVKRSIRSYFGSARMARYSCALAGLSNNSVRVNPRATSPSTSQLMSDSVTQSTPSGVRPTPSGADGERGELPPSPLPLPPSVGGYGGGECG